MKFEQLYSSSRGNLYILSAASGKRLMIECGVSWSDMQKALNYNLSGIVGCLLTHSHADHSKAVKDVMRAGIDVYASAGTINALGIADNRRARQIANKTLVRFNGSGLQVIAFDVNHDAAEPLGFLIKDNDEFMLFATDTSHIQQRWDFPFSIIALECSYDKDILQKRVDTLDINETLAKRLLTSHLEKQNTMRYIADFCNLSKCSELHLLHLSGDNIDKAQTKIDFEKRFFIGTKIAN